MANEGKGYTFGTLLIAAMAALGLSSQRGAQLPTDMPARGEPMSLHSASAAIYDKQEHSAAKMLEDFFDNDREQFQIGKPWSRYAKPIFPQTSSYQIQYLIVTMPEPDSQPLRYKFDTYLDAVDAAANVTGFVPDSFDLPWLPSSGDQSAEFKLSQPIDVMGASGEHEAELKPDRNEETRADRDPGIMLFRNDNTDPKSLLVLFLIGESPTRGVNRIELRSAMDQISWLSGWRRKPYDPPPPNIKSMSSESQKQLKILGPTFSGSADSLHLTIDEWRSSFGTADKAPQTKAALIDPRVIPKICPKGTPKDVYAAGMRGLRNGNRRY